MLGVAKTQTSYWRTPEGEVKLLQQDSVFVCLFLLAVKRWDEALVRCKINAERRF